MSDERRRAPRARTIFEVFYQRYQGAWRHFGYLYTGDKAAAELYKNVGEDWLAEHGGEPRPAQTAAFSRVARTAMDYCRGRFEVMEEPLGLYSAIAGLPEHQRDVIILRHMMGHPDANVADILGIFEAPVRSHLRHARNSLEPVATEHRLLHATENEG